MSGACENTVAVAEGGGDGSRSSAWTDLEMLIAEAGEVSANPEHPLIQQLHAYAARTQLPGVDIRDIFRRVEEECRKVFPNTPDFVVTDIKTAELHNKSSVFWHIVTVAGMDVQLCKDSFFHMSARGLLASDENVDAKTGERMFNLASRAVLAFYTAPIVAFIADASGAAHQAHMRMMPHPEVPILCGNTFKDQHFNTPLLASPEVPVVAWPTGSDGQHTFVDAFQYDVVHTILPECRTIPHLRLLIDRFEHGHNAAIEEFTSLIERCADACADLVLNTSAAEAAAAAP